MGAEDPNCSFDPFRFIVTAADEDAGGFIVFFEPLGAGESVINKLDPENEIELDAGFVGLAVVVEDDIVDGQVEADDVE